MMMGMIGPSTIITGGGFALTYQSSIATSSTASPITYAPSGGYAAGAPRTICLVQYYANAGATVTGVTIDGVALTPISGAAISTGDKAVAAFISSAPLTGNASASVVVTYSANNTFVSAIALYNLTTTTPAAGTPATLVNTSAGATITAGPVSIPAGGGGLFATFPYLSNTGTITSGNAVIDGSPVAGGTTFYFAHTTATGSQSVTLTYSVNDAGPAMLIPWGP